MSRSRPQRHTRGGFAPRPSAPELFEELPRAILPCSCSHIRTCGPYLGQYGQPGGRLSRAPVRPQRLPDRAGAALAAFHPPASAGRVPRGHAVRRQILRGCHPQGEPPQSAGLPRLSPRGWRRRPIVVPRERTNMRAAGSPERMSSACVPVVRWPAADGQAAAGAAPRGPWRGGLSEAPSGSGCAWRPCSS